jgi:hypothetical protein
MQLDDHWQVSSALGYLEPGRLPHPFAVFRLPEQHSGWRLDTQLKVTF